MTEMAPMAFVTAPGQVEFRDRPLPQLGPQDIRLHVKAVTLCGSDLHIFKGKHPAAPLPVPVGHELAGQVEAVGAEVTTIRPGDRVVVEPVIACGVCHFCRRGQYHLCQEISFQYRRGQGALTTTFTAPQRWVHRLPEALSYAAGALIEPLSVALHAVQKSNLQVGMSSAIFGAGPIGLLLLQLVRLAGGGTTIIVDVHDHRLETARRFGADVLVNNRTADVLSVVAEHSAGLGVDRAFEAVGLNLTLVQALQVLRKGGLAVLVGLFEQAEVQLPANIFVQREIALLGAQGYNWDFQTAIPLAAAGRLDLEALITHRFPLSQTQQAFETLLDPDQQAVKVMIDIEA